MDGQTFVAIHSLCPRNPQVLTDTENQYLRDMASPRLHRATIHNPQTGKLEHANYRVSKSAWLKKRGSDPVINRITGASDISQPGFGPRDKSLFKRAWLLMSLGNQLGETYAVYIRNFFSSQEIGDQLCFRCVQCALFKKTIVLW